MINGSLILQMNGKVVTTKCKSWIIHEPYKEQMS